MELEKSLISGSMSLLVLKLLEDGDLYGYQMIAELRRRSDDTFRLRAGTLYPLLHSLEEKGFVTAYEQTAESGKARRYTA
nr:PadR family transcriptional regulator [uncultured Oscillibacter sp.]